MGVPPNHPKLNYLSIKTHAFGDPPFWEPTIYIYMYI
jgi:hypothetical protein